MLLLSLEVLVVVLAVTSAVLLVTAPLPPALVVPLVTAVTLVAPPAPLCTLAAWLLLLGLEVALPLSPPPAVTAAVFALGSSFPEQLALKTSSEPSMRGFPIALKGEPPSGRIDRGIGCS